MKTAAVLAAATPLLWGGSIPASAQVTVWPTGGVLAQSAQAVTEEHPAGNARVLPAGWREVTSPQGTMLEWTSPTVLPVSDTPVAVRVGDREFKAAVRGRTVVVPRAVLPTDVTSLVAVHRGTPVASSMQMVPPQGRHWDVAVAGQNTRVAPDVVSATYTAGSLRAAGMPSSLPISGKIIAPRTASGPRPVVLFAHGRHQWCYAKGALSDTWPCVKGYAPVPSLLGYEYVQNQLAAQGYITVSIDLNAINAQDNQVSGNNLLDDSGITARGELIRAHLKQFAQWTKDGTAPFSATVSAQWDLSQVVLVGHSRGGDGVVRAASMSDASDPFTLRGLVPLAPTNFDRRSPGYVPTFTVLPGCDGDVSDLQGQSITDRSLDMGGSVALHSTAYVPGANHNFFNTQWTPGPSLAPSEDDARNSVCASSARQSPEQQRLAALLLITTAVRAFVQHDADAMNVVQGGAPAVPGWTGRGAIRITPVGGKRTVAWRGNVADTPLASLTQASLCSSGVMCAPGSFDEMTPHWQSSRIKAPAAVLNLSGEGTPSVLRWSTPQAARDMPYLEARIVVPPGTRVALKARVTDADGHTADVTPVVGLSLCGFPCGKVADDARGGRWLAQMMRVDLRSAPGVDVQRLQSVEWRSAAGPARVVLLDMAFSAMASDPAQRELGQIPRMEVSPQVATVKEGNVTHVVRVPVSFSAPLPAPVTIWSEAPPALPYLSGAPDIHRRVTIPVGATSAEIPLATVGNTLDDEDVFPLRVAVDTAGPVRLAGAQGGANIVDDDPTPTLTVTPVVASVQEGRTLTWRATLSALSNREVRILASAVPPGGRELSTTDVTLQSFREWMSYQKRRTVVLSKGKATSVWTLGPRTLSGLIFVGTVKDRVREPAERIRFTVDVSAATLKGNKTFTGTVLSN